VNAPAKPLRSSYTYRCPRGHGCASFVPDASLDPVACQHKDRNDHVCNAPMERMEAKKR